MPADVSVHAVRPVGPAAAARRPLDLVRDWRWRQTAPRWWDQAVLVPSWSKAPRLTTAVCAARLGRRLAALGHDAVVVFTLPYYAGLAGRWPGVPKVYFAYDPYGCYTGWDPAVVAAGERQLLAHCDAAFAISPALADDFRRLTDRPVFVQPNGVSESFLAAFGGPLPPPADLPLGGPPVVGCVGQISRAYDWDLLADVVRLCPDLAFVFVGPVFDEGPAVRARTDAVLAAPNVRWLGPKPHAELPRYIQRFDVCLNPLRVEPCNDRRSLLRLYDYLASDRPVVSTAVASALDHRPHVEIGHDASGLAELLRRRVAAPAVDRAARRGDLRRHTWEKRAELFLSNLRSILNPAAS
jgi:glycosyltransferase involved in cell wall biosynthesis